MADDFRFITFSAGQPITSTDLNQLMANQQSIFNQNKSLQNTVKDSSGNTRNVVNKIASGIRTIKGLGDAFQETTVNISNWNFSKDPIVTASIAEKLEKTEDVDLYVYDIGSLSFKIGVRIQGKKSSRTTLDVNWIAISEEPI